MCVCVGESVCVRVLTCLCACGDSRLGEQKKFRREEATEREDQEHLLSSGQGMKTVKSAGKIGLV